VAALKGARAVGIAGGADKCAYATRELGFSACIDHRSPSFADELAGACPKGIDVYYENVGGEVFAAALPLMNVGGRIPVCGLISLYNATSPPTGPDRTGAVMRTILVKRLKVQGFIISDHYGAPYEAFVREMSGWLASGAVRYREYVVDGLERAPDGFIEMMRGGNLGKTIVRIAGD
jgi:NADPH-dependent curcumin reductase CurA